MILPASGSARLTIRRTSEWNSRFRKFRILLDGNEIGRIKNGATEHFELEPGDHEVQIAIDWCSSHSMTIHAEFGVTVTLVCGHSQGPLLARRAARSHPEQYLFLAIDDLVDEASSTKP